MYHPLQVNNAAIVLEAAADTILNFPLTVQLSSTGLSSDEKREKASQITWTCSKSTTETSKACVKYVQS